MSTHRTNDLSTLFASPESAGMSEDRLRRLDDHFKRNYIENGRLPGIHTLVYRRGKVVHSAAQGFADLERQVPLRDDTLFRIFSMTKPITSLAMMMLVEEGKVALDEPVHKYIPEWRNLGVYVGGMPTLGRQPAGPLGFITKPTTRPMQIVDLLRHTSGLTYDFLNRTAVDAAYRAMKIDATGSNMAIEAMIETLSRLPLEFSPGEAFNYSISTDVLGYLIGKISGEPLELFMKKRIFDPLGMVDTGFHVPTEKAHRLAALYAADGKGGKMLQDDPATSSYLRPPSFVSGGVGLISSTADYLKFCRMALGRGALGDNRLISPKTFALMTANHLPGGKSLADSARALFDQAAYDGVGFGLGFATTMVPAKTLIPGSAGEFGWYGAATTSFWVDPAEELIVVFMTQCVPSWAYPVRHDLRTLVYSAITESNL